MLRSTQFLLVAVSLFSAAPTAFASGDQARQEHAISTVQLPKGELTLGDRKSWTESGLTMRQALWEGDPNDLPGNWTQIDVTLGRGDVEKKDRIQTDYRANFLSVFDPKSKNTWWVPFEAIADIKVGTPTADHLAGVERITEIYGRFNFLGKPETISNIQASVAVKLTTPYAENQHVVEGLVVGGLRFRTGGKWQDMRWSDISAIAFRRDPKGLEGGQPPRFTYRTRGASANVWSEYEFPRDSGNKSQEKKPNHGAEPIR
jgi:hypothetical protein